MYQQHFGLDELPFSLTPDTGFVYRHAGHQEAVNELLSGLQAGEGFIAVIAEVGSGKTLLCRKLLTLLPDNWAAAYLPNPLLTSLELYSAIAAELGVTTESKSLKELQQLIFERLTAVQRVGGQTLVLIDEAQAMSQNSLEALRLLSNLETEKRKLLQVVFFAQPELERRLEHQALRQLRQRITSVCRLKPMHATEIKGYLDYRMTVAGYSGSGLFSASAVRRISRSSGGSPRLVNILAHKALLAAYGRGDTGVCARRVDEAVADTISVQGANILGVPLTQFWIGFFSSLAVSLLLVFLLKGGLL